MDYKLETMPGIGLVTVASFAAEIGDIKRFASADKLARLAGIAPTAFGSGENGGRGDNHKKCKQGKTTGQAMICVMRRLVNTIYGMMKTKTAYVQPEQQRTKAS